MKLENDVWIQTELSPEKESVNNCDRDLERWSYDLKINGIFPECDICGV